MVSLSLVIPVLNAVRTLPHCLAALRNLDPKPHEILLVDNGSEDGSQAVLDRFARESGCRGVQVLTETRRGAAAARNKGIREAKGEVIAFTDADCAPAPVWLRFLTEPFAEPKVGAVAGRVVGAPAASTMELFSALYTLQLPDRPARHHRWTPWEGGYPTANLAVRHALLRELGGFDEHVGIYGEDYDLCARLYARGAELVYLPEACVAHHHRIALRSLLRQAFGFGRSHPYLLGRHATRGLWLSLPVRSMAWPGCPVRAWIDLASADKKMAGLLGLGALYRPVLWLLPVYAGWLSLAAARRAGRSGVRVSPAAALGLASLLLLKSGAMTAGRWWGSVKYGTICM